MLVEIKNIKPDLSEECFAKMRGKKFVAVVMDEENDTWHMMTNKINGQEAVYGMTKAIANIVDYGHIDLDGCEE